MLVPRTKRSGVNQTCAPELGNTLLPNGETARSIPREHGATQQHRDDFASDSGLLRERWPSV